MLIVKALDILGQSYISLDIMGLDIMGQTQIQMVKQPSQVKD